ncbi:MAG: CBS domain-containing protein, partial [Campylobacterales bacterium]|nr:CBS domain-containing protein [Campylobacterales bacterium]
MKNVSDFEYSLNEQISYNATLKECVQAIYNNKKHSVVLVKDGKTVGILSERDIVELYSKNIDFDKKAIEVASSNVISILSTRDIEYAINLMIDNGIRRVVVVDNNRDVIGILTQEDIINHIEKDIFQTKLKISNILKNNQEVYSCDKNATIDDVSNLMSLKKVSMIPILEENRAIGIVTEIDLVKFSIQNISKNEKISNLMTTSIKSVHEDEFVEDAIGFMKSYNIRHLIIENSDKKIIGVITYSDIVRTLQGNYKHYLEQKLKQHQKTLNTIPQYVINAVYTNNEILVQWANKKALELDAQMIDKNICEVLNDNICKEVFDSYFLNKPLENMKINLFDSYFELSTNINGNNVQIILNNVTKYELIAKKYSSVAQKEQSIKNLLKTIINSLPTPIFYKDRNGIFLECNNAFADLFSTSREKIVGNTLEKIFPALDIDKIEDHDRYV